jgi:ABC-type Mn2+/Zn2+ transport system permease subunit/heat shock protein HslJ
MQRAFAAALVVGTLCSTIGVYVVLRKLSFIGDGIAHASFAGVVVAYIRGLDYYVGAAIVAVITALGIGYVNRRGKVSLDTAIGVLFTGAFALGVFLMSRLKSYSVDLQSFLFGDILAVSRADLILILSLSFIVAISLALLYRPLLYTSFDPVVAEASGIRAAFVDYALLVLLALTIIISLETVGIVLVAALLVTPAASAYQLTRRFTRMMVISACIGAGCAVAGLYASYYLQGASGATIVLLATLVFFVSMAFGRLRKRRLAAAFVVAVACVAGGAFYARPAFANQNVDFTDTRWLLYEPGAEAPEAKLHTTIEFDARGNISGSTGCSHYSMPIEHLPNGESRGKYISVTHENCVTAGQQRHEKLFVQAIHGVQRFQLAGPYLLMYFSGSTLPLRFTEL